jgi:ribosomal protein L7/L12
MKITVTKQEAERTLETYFFHKLEEAPLSVHIEDMEPVQKIHSVTYTSEMVQSLWKYCVSPTDTYVNFAHIKITLIKVYRELHFRLTGENVSLLNAKNFIESHKAH